MELIGAIFGILAIFAGVLGMAVLLGALRGFVAAKLWLWFVVPTFGVAPLPIAAAFGLALLVGYLTHQTPPTIKKEYRESSTALLLLSPLVTLLVGWVAHTFFM